MLREILSAHFSISPNGLGEFDTRGLQRCICTLYDGNPAWLSEWISVAREFFHGRADAMEFTDPVDAIAPVPLICRRGMYSEMAFIYKGMLATKMVWMILSQEQPSINSLLTANQRTLMDLVEVPEDLLGQLKDSMPAMLEDIKAAYLDEDEHDEVGGDLTDSKSLENAEIALVMHFLLREANINQCDMTAVTRLMVALSGRGYDNLYKKIRDPFQGNQRMVLKRMLRIKPLIEDLRNESIMLKFNKEMQKLRI
jgi:hypothetical protein